LRIVTKYLILFILLSSAAMAQHYQFSQFYAAPTYLNPAFTGANACSRVTLNYRNQWSRIPGTYTTYQCSYDHYIKEINSGIGVQFYSDKAGPGSLRSTQFSLLYAYELRLSKALVMRGGISAGGIQRSVDMNGLTFGDQIARGGASSSVEELSGIKTMYFDLGGGYLLYTKNLWAGFSVNHINQPNQSLLDQSSRLPAELKVHAGYKFLLDDEDAKKASEKNSITVAANFHRQQKFNQLDLGMYYSKSYLVLGLWYRGIPFYRSYANYSNRDALIFLVGVSADKFNIGYSYDYTVSKLTNVSSGGSHEISLSYQFCSPKKKKKKAVLISCPKF
jgi:type IX secretion system PorP/SprF family membrane protein